jgi:hypothetical protein
MHPAGEVIDRLGGLDQLPGLLLGRLPRIGERGQHPLVALQLADGRLAGDREQDDVATLFGLPDLPRRDPRRRLVERLEVPLDVLRIGQLPRHPDHPAQELERRRHRARGGKVIHQLGGNPGVLQILLDFPGVLLVVLLAGLRRDAGCLDQNRRDGELECAAKHRASLGEPSALSLQPSVADG